MRRRIAFSPAALFVVAACGASSNGGDSVTFGPDGSVDGSPVVDAGDVTASDASTTSMEATTDALFDAAAADQAHARADAAVEAMLLAFWDGGAEYLDATAGAAGATGYWTFAQAWDAVLDAVERHSNGRFTGTLRTFYDAQNAVGWSRTYYDDENWMTLALIRAFDLTQDATYLDEAKTLYADIMSAWDATCCGSTPGGIWWSTAHDSKVTAINAGAVVSGARLYERTQDASYLTFAQQAFAYWSANMVDATSHHVYDDISSAGVKNTTWTFTYNEGLMIGACVELAKATGDTSTLALADQIAGYMLASETESTPGGTILSDGSNTSCSGDCVQFKGIGARYLAALYAADTSHAEYLGLLTRSADSAWSVARDSTSGLFGVDWGAAIVPPAQLDATSSAAMVLARVAALEGPAPADPANTYEAEEGVLHGVGLEATYGAFDGWGYVAGWNADGQSVDFLVDAPADGIYDVTFRYAAGAGDASRTLSVDGSTVVANLAFASTGGWDTYATQTGSVAMTHGVNTISLVYDSSMGSSSYLNLDQLSFVVH
jgi:predicted alpha-1,6-mannanase (GH76 family)